MKNFTFRFVFLIVSIFLSYSTITCKKTDLLDILFEAETEVEQDSDASLATQEDDEEVLDADESEQEPVNSSSPCSLLDLLLADTADVASVFPDRDKKYYRGQFEMIGLHYLDVSMCDKQMSAQMRQARSIDQDMLTDQEKEVVEKYYHLVKQQYEAPWYMKFISKKVGYGIFAAADIEPGQLIGEYTGIFYDSATYTNKTPKNHNYAWSIAAPQLSKNAVGFHVDAKEYCNFTRMINHSYEPNVIPVVLHAPDGSHMLYVAVEKIKKDQQILVNYGEGYWQGREPEELSR